MQSLQRRFSPALLANAAILLTMLFWGTSFINTKIALNEIPPVTLAFIRFALTSVLLLFALRKTEPRSALDKTDGWKIALAGFTGIAIYFCFENTGIYYTTASNASLIASLAPILSIALNMLFFRARLSVLEGLGVALGIGGAYLTVTANGNLDFSSDHFLGNLFMLGAMMAWSFYTILSKHLQGRRSGLFLVTYQTLFGTLLLAPLALLEYDRWQAFSFLALAQILYLAVLCSGVGYFLYIYALKELDVAVTTLYLNLIPVIGVISGYLILDERILPIQLVGGGVILLAIFIANLDKTRKLFHF